MGAGFAASSSGRKPRSSSATRSSPPTDWPTNPPATPIASPGEWATIPLSCRSGWAAERSRSPLARTMASWSTARIARPRRWQQCLSPRPKRRSRRSSPASARVPAAAQAKALSRGPGLAGRAGVTRRERGVWQMDERDWLAERFEERRSRLRAVAYRMLGSLSEADDAVQEAWLRLSRTDAGAIENLDAGLTTVVARVSLNMLRARKSKREEPIGVRMPDPIV